MIVVAWAVTTETLTEDDYDVGTALKIWVDGDTDQVGAYRGQIVVTTSGRQETYPSDGSMIIWVVHRALE